MADGPKALIDRVPDDRADKLRDLATRMEREAAHWGRAPIAFGLRDIAGRIRTIADVGIVRTGARHHG